MFNNLDNPSAVLDARVIHLATTESYRLCGHHPARVHIHFLKKQKSKPVEFLQRWIMRVAAEDM
jgi:hypothetical protein